MSTREAIIHIADQLIRDKGFNAFSFYDISKALGIKNASIHYYFPTKTRLGVSVVKAHQAEAERLMRGVENSDPVTKLNAFLSIYTHTKAEGRVCIVGSLATDLHTVDAEIQEELKKFVNSIIHWVTGILEEGKKQNIFFFTVPARTKALMVITNMLASVQLTRLTGDKDFTAIKKTILKELKA
ncbi:TetR/AcrR family transcriptional regulator [Foetidibacter luteolus]|uniref:TetR/AcrR family transcriptional regulator n=1 Tax=Foetidibacter luteolus TaxID=2608880 RepID=UPI00129A1125|nr:TetR/AcrR family transcriptional regulator [Foetidibacter luteolus]